MAYSEAPAKSFKVTVIARVFASISTWPKNCMPLVGGALTSVGAFWYITCMPNVASVLFGPNPPALSGPETNSQSGRLPNWGVPPTHPPKQNLMPVLCVDPSLFSKQVEINAEY